MKRHRVVTAGAGLAGLVMLGMGLPGQVVAAAEAHTEAAQASSALVDTMESELHRAMNSLGSTDNAGQQPKPYFMSYVVSDAEQASIGAQFGAITSSNASHRRFADVRIRIGTPAEDNTHGDHRNSALTTIPLPLTDDGAAIARSLWFATNRGYGKALDGYLKVKTDQEVRAKEEDGSPDFSREKEKVALLPLAPPLKIDRTEWETRLRELSGLFKQYPDVFYNTVALEASSETDYFVSSEGAKIATPNHVARLIVLGRTRAADGMDMFRAETFEADEAGHLPGQKVLAAKVTEMGKSLEALRVAPVTDPYNGPAILSGRAAAVFFHEVLGHRLEGQRQRGDEEGQTFTKLMGKQILPSFMSVSDDPTLTKFDGTWLSGHYDYDDEGQQARRVDLIKDGVLETFLMSRQPVAGFANSNGHGRAEVGRMPTGRQGNLIVTSSKTVNDAELRQMLIAEAKKQGKAYGLYFEDISSGFAVTTRRSPQAFQVIPLVVYRVYVDGRPDELVRGVSIVGTPQAALARIVATGDKAEVFNGICGAESGSIPVSAVAPAMLVSEIETQKQAQGNARPPILPPPTAGNSADAVGKVGGQ
ncbi:metallopeptidase TldD-related protein [Edaphobacter paludis]|uniref:Metallopeptidase TldD-related protein n=1 Tax=Edaphobacter paludis TaxID=3035702 RepID=A0AAU7CX70_9BACT